MKSTVSELIRRKRLLKHVLLGLIAVLGLICLYNGSTFAPGAEEVISLDDGTDPITGSFRPKRDYFDELFEDQEQNPEVPKSLPVSCL